MSEADAIWDSDRPATRGSLAEDLRRLGLTAGRVVLVHAVLSRLGWASGGAVAVVQALLDVIGPGGTLVVPAMNGDNSDPANWVHPSVPEAWHEEIRATLPAYDPAMRAVSCISDKFAASGRYT